MRHRPRFAETAPGIFGGFTAAHSGGVAVLPIVPSRQRRDPMTSHPSRCCRTMPGLVTVTTVLIVASLIGQVLKITCWPEMKRMPPSTI
jgi:hypothetical protein